MGEGSREWEEGPLTPALSPGYRGEGEGTTGRWGQVVGGDWKLGMVMGLFPERMESSERGRTEVQVTASRTSTADFLVRMDSRKSEMTKKSPPPWLVLVASAPRDFQ